MPRGRVRSPLYAPRATTNASPGIVSSPAGPPTTTPVTPFSVARSPRIAQP